MFSSGISPITVLAGCDGWAVHGVPQVYQSPILQVTRHQGALARLWSAPAAEWRPALVDRVGPIELHRAGREGRDVNLVGQMTPVDPVATTGPTGTRIFQWHVADCWAPALAPVAS